MKLKIPEQISHLISLDYNEETRLMRVYQNGNDGVKDKIWHIERYTDDLYLPFSMKLSDFYLNIGINVQGGPLHFDFGMIHTDKALLIRTMNFIGMANVGA